MDRKTFLGGLAATFGGVILPVEAFGGETKPLMRFGVASDVHILRGWKQEHYLEKALRWFDAQKADAVLFPGDMAHTGRVSELESLAAVWEKVFPNCTAADGRRVERMLVTGNHEISQWPGLWDRFSDEELKKVRFDYDREHMNATSRRPSRRRLSVRLSSLDLVSREDRRMSASWRVRSSEPRMELPFGIIPL